MHKLLSQSELAARADITPDDKGLVEGIVVNLLDTGETPECTRARAIRGYVVSLMEESVLDDELRKELDGDASAFDDGWTAAFEITSLIAESLGKSLESLEAAAARLHSYSQALRMGDTQILIDGEGYTKDEIKEAIALKRKGEPKTLEEIAQRWAGVFQMFKEAGYVRAQPSVDSEAHPRGKV